ncbi:MAG TPA: DHA2 family efflux MFS transporter permease subunit, partial [Acidobacteriaceae bacterium]
VVAPVIGPTLGGWLTDTYSWRYAFYINLPVGALAVFMINRFVHDPPYIKNAKVSPFDGIGFGLLAVWIGCLQVILDKGQEDDWFGATWIRWAAFFLVVSFVWFVVHSWRARQPLVNLRTLKNWNFAIGCTLIMIFGVAIYSLVTILPLYYQELLGYTAFTAGLAVGPRGIGSILGMPIIAYLGSRVDPRILLSFGFGIFGAMAIVFGNLTLGLGPWTLLVPILVSGFALSFVFVPITTQAYGTLPNAQIGNASGIFNLVRNLGGSVGISVAQTLLTRRSDAHQNYITNSVSTSSYWLEDRLRSLTLYLGHQTHPSNARAAAQGQLYSQLGAQALLWAFVDVFRWLALICFAGVGIVWMFKKVAPGKPPQGAH